MTDSHPGVSVPHSIGPKIPLVVEISTLHGPCESPEAAKSGKVALLTLFRNNDSCVVEPACLRYPPVNLISTIRSFQKLDNGCDFLNCLQCLHPSQRCKGSSNALKTSVIPVLRQIPGRVCAGFFPLLPHMDDFRRFTGKVEFLYFCVREHFIHPFCDVDIANCGVDDER